MIGAVNLFSGFFVDRRFSFRHYKRRTKRAACLDTSLSCEDYGLSIEQDATGVLYETQKVSQP